MENILKSFIVFEGLDGAGTTTQIMNLARYYEFNKREYFLTREPTDSPIGQLVRKVLQKKVSTTPEALALLKKLEGNLEGENLTIRLQLKVQTVEKLRKLVRNGKLSEEAFLRLERRVHAMGN